ncbi:TrmB family transcriptional regulator [Halogeometricum borinquense]|uniref:TrmB family transcriptional regulator n=1 Tax=Halogeometricum borinquense TaxID=60847 RepID=A0A6C0UF18_9EURY|nr:TrmB family transcriptional regulator [Halogeometricum borinquense]QIB74044.1 TrmB family transcriptional regulator [Halogeometricum borinquense]
MTALSELGLSSYEEKVYRTLLVTGAVTATELSAASSVPKGRIYDVLNGLEARTLIQSQSTDPTRYIAVDPETAVDRLLAERTDELQREWNRYHELAATIHSDLPPTPAADGSVWLGTLGSDEMNTAIRQHVQTATRSVRGTVGPPYEHASWETLRSEFDAFFDAMQTDISVSLILSDEMLTTLPETFPELVKSKSVDISISVLPEIPVSFDIIDQTTTMIDIPDPQGADRFGVVGVKETDIVAEFERQFQQLWSDAIPLIG